MVAYLRIVGRGRKPRNAQRNAQRIQRVARPEPATLVLLMFAAAGWCPGEVGREHRKYQQLINA